MTLYSHNTYDLWYNPMIYNLESPLIPKYSLDFDYPIASSAFIEFNICYNAMLIQFLMAL